VQVMTTAYSLEGKYPKLFLCNVHDIVQLIIAISIKVPGLVEVKLDNYYTKEHE